MVRLTTVDEALTYFTRRGLTRENIQELFLVKPDGTKSKTTAEFKDMDKTISSALKDSGHTIESNTTPAKALAKADVLEALPKSLNPIYRLWAFMHFTKTNVEIGKALGIKEDSVRVRMLRLLGQKTHTIQTLLPMVLATSVDISYIFPEGSLTNARLNAWFGDEEATATAAVAVATATMKADIEVNTEVDTEVNTEVNTEGAVDEPKQEGSQDIDEVVTETQETTDDDASQITDESDVIPEGDDKDDSPDPDPEVVQDEYVDCNLCEDGDTDYICPSCEAKSTVVSFDTFDEDNKMNTSVLEGSAETDLVVEPEVTVIESLSSEPELPVEDVITPMAADSTGGGLDDMNF